MPQLDDDEQPVIGYERERFSAGEAISHYVFAIELVAVLEV